MLELFSGTGEISKQFRENGFETFEVDWDKKFNSDLHIDIEQLTTEMVVDKFGIPDVLWMAFDCTTYSLAAISHHRTKNPTTGNLDPKSEYAKKCDRINKHCLRMLSDFQKLNPQIIFFIENPRGGLGKMDFMQPLEKYKNYITYCRYMTDVPVEKRRMKPTNIWTNHPSLDFLPPCKYGDTCHPSAPRGSKTGTQGLKGSKERSRYPKLLIEHIAEISADFVNKETQPKLERIIPEEEPKARQLLLF